MPRTFYRAENGHVIYFDRDHLPEGIGSRIARGDLQRVNEDGTEWLGEPDGPDQGGDPGAAAPDDAGSGGVPDSPEAPKKSASKADWVEFAVSQGADAHEAAAMTRDDLVAAFAEPAAS